MNRKELHNLLIEYVEGTLAPPLRSKVEDYLRSSKQAREEYELVRNAFSALQQTQETEPPKHYFTNLLPRLREKIASTHRPSRWTEILQRFQYAADSILLSPPVAAAFIVMALAGTFFIFMPSSPEQHFATLVRDAKQEDVARLSEESLPFMEQNDANVVERIAEMIHINNLERRLHQSLFASDEIFSTLQTNEAFSDVEPIITTLNDFEMDIVMQKLDLPIYN